MKFDWFRLLPIVTMAVGCGVFSAASQADLLCDTPEVRNMLPDLPKGCHRERIQASGGLSFGVLNSASKLAERAWEREVLTKYGERYKDVKDAACLKTLCVSGSISGTKRCTISGFPCAADMDAPVRNDVTQLASRYDSYGPGGSGGGGGSGGYDGGGYGRPSFSVLSPDQIAEMQRFLGVTPDGIFGGESQQALRQFRRSAGLRIDGPPTREDLDLLRRRR